MPTLLQRCVRNTCLPAAFFPIPKILMQTGIRSGFPDYDLIISDLIPLAFSPKNRNLSYMLTYTRANAIIRKIIFITGNA